jgi:hypothetical protein
VQVLDDEQGWLMRGETDDELAEGCQETSPVVVAVEGQGSGRDAGAREEGRKFRQELHQVVEQELLLSDGWSWCRLSEEPAEEVEEWGVGEGGVGGEAAPLKQLKAVVEGNGFGCCDQARFADARLATKQRGVTLITWWPHEQCSQGSLLAAASDEDRAGERYVGAEGHRRHRNMGEWLASVDSQLFVCTTYEARPL